jgi:hypothetical protein
MTRRSALITVAIGVVLGIAHFATLDGIVGVLDPLLYATDTRYAPGYSDAAFRRVTSGMQAQQVRELLSTPLQEVWDYGGTPSCFVRVVDGVVVNAIELQDCHKGFFRQGTRAAQVLTMWGPPPSTHWLYSDSPSGNSYRERIIYFSGDVVSRKIADFYVD